MNTGMTRNHASIPVAMYFFIFAIGLGVRTKGTRMNRIPITAQMKLIAITRKAVLIRGYP